MYVGIECGQQGFAFGVYLGNTPVGHVFESTNYTRDNCNLSGCFSDSRLDSFVLIEVPEGITDESKVLEFVQSALPA